MSLATRVGVLHPFPFPFPFPFPKEDVLDADLVTDRGRSFGIG